MSSATVRALAARHDADHSWVWDGPIPDRFSFEDFPDFGRQYLFGLSLLKDEEDLATATDDLAAVLASQNVRYANSPRRRSATWSAGWRPRSTATASSRGDDAPSREVSRSAG